MPLLAKGEPLIWVEVPVVGSYQKAAIDGFENFAMSTESVAKTGVYAIASESPEDQAAVA
jgi:hypothetical protein